MVTKGYKQTSEHIAKRFKNIKGKTLEQIYGKDKAINIRENLSIPRIGKPINHLKNFQFKKGHKPSNFIDGSSRNRFYQLNEWKEIAKKCYSRDNWTCQTCGKRGGTLNAHHKIPYSISKDNSLDNLITLCVECHSKIHKKCRDEKGRWKN